MSLSLKLQRRPENKFQRLQTTVNVQPSTRPDEARLEGHAPGDILGTCLSGVPGNRTTVLCMLVEAVYGRASAVPSRHAHAVRSHDKRIQ